MLEKETFCLWLLGHFGFFTCDILSLTAFSATTLVFTKTIEKYRVKAYGKTLMIFLGITIPRVVPHRFYWWAHGCTAVQPHSQPHSWETPRNASGATSFVSLWLISPAVLIGRHTRLAVKLTVWMLQEVHRSILGTAPRFRLSSEFLGIVISIWEL